MSLRTLSQNKFSAKRYNTTNKVYAKYWSAYVSGASVYGNASGSAFKHLAVDSTGAIYSVGTTNLGSGSDDALLIKFDTSGSLVWQKALGQSGISDSGNSIVIDSSDNIFICGTNGTGPFLAKYDTSGNLIAQTRVTPVTNTSISPQCMDVNNSTGQIYLGGWYTNSSGYYYGLIQRYGSDLSLLNMKIWGSNTSGTNPYNHGIIIDQSTGDFYVSGYRQTGSAIMVGKFSADTTAVWAYTYNLGVAYQLGISGDGYIYVVGSYGSSSSTPFLTKINSSGAVIWTRRLTGIVASGLSLSFDLYGNIFIATNSNAANNYNVYIAKFNDIGDLLWQNYIDGPNSDQPVGIICDVKGDIIFTIYDITNAKITLFHLPGDGSLNNASYNSGVNYGYYPSSLVLNTTTVFTPTLFTATLSTQIPAATQPMVSQTVSHTISTLVIG